MDRELVGGSAAWRSGGLRGPGRRDGDRLFAIAHRILWDVDRAEDALQDALVIAWRDLPGLRDPDRFDAGPARAHERVHRAPTS